MVFCVQGEMGIPGMPGSSGETGTKGDRGFRGPPGQRGQPGPPVSHTHKHTLLGALFDQAWGLSDNPQSSQIEDLWGFPRFREREKREKRKKVLNVLIHILSKSLGGLNVASPGSAPRLDGLWLRLVQLHA